MTDSTPESSASASAARASERPFELTSDAPWPSQYANDPLWMRAAAGDDLDQARLGRREGADGLFQALEHGGRLGRVALAALEFASDRGAARGALCALIARAEPPSVGPLLAALLEVTVNAPAVEGSLDPAADARCPSVMGGLLKRDLPSPADHDRAALVLSRLPPP